MRVERPTWCGMFWFVVLAAVSCTAHATPPPSCSVATVAPSRPTGLADRVQLLEDKQAIEELKAAYIFAIDAVLVDAAKIDSLLVLLHDDICLDYGPLGIHRGKQEVRHFFQVTAPAAGVWSFHVASHPILVVHGTRATGVWKLFTAAVARSDTSQVQYAYASYQDEYVKTADGWKFKVIRVLFDLPPTTP